MPDTRPSDARTRQVMSLDFIAPAEDALRRPIFRDQCLDLRLQHIPVSRSGWLLAQGMVDSTRSTSMLGCYDGRYDMSSASPPQLASLDSGSLIGSPTASIISDSVSKAAKRRRDDDRYSYDDEEKYAILYFRIERGEKWADVMKNFGVLFPPGRPRRQPGKALTERYVERRKGGLECRYYRLREDHGFRPLRSPEYDLNDDRRTLARLLMTMELDDGFLQRLKDL